MPFTRVQNKVHDHHHQSMHRNKDSTHREIHEPRSRHNQTTSDKITGICPRGVSLPCTRGFANLRASSGLGETSRQLAASKVNGSESEKTRNGVLWRMREGRTPAGVAHARCLPCMRTHFVLSCLILRAKVVRCFSQRERERERESLLPPDPCQLFVPSIAGLALLCLSDGDQRERICEYCGLICHQLRRGRAVHNHWREGLGVPSLFIPLHRPSATTAFFSPTYLLPSTYPRSLLHPSTPILQLSKAIV